MKTLTDLKESAKQTLINTEITEKKVNKITTTYRFAEVIKMNAGNKQIQKIKTRIANMP